MTNVTKEVKIKIGLILMLTADGRTLRQGYYKLGILSTSFAEMEQLVQELITVLMGFQDVVALHLIEENTLAKNLQLLGKVNKYYKHKPSDFKAIMERIDKVREDRNWLIHGAWTLGLNATTKVPTISVVKSKIRHNNDENGEYWAKRIYKNYTFNDLDKLVINTKEIVRELKNLIASIK